MMTGDVPKHREQVKNHRRSVRKLQMELDLMDGAPEQKKRSPVEHEEPAVSLHQSHSAALQSGSVDMHTVAMVTCVAVKVPGCLGPLRSLHSKPQVLFCWHLFPAFQNFTGHFSYFGEAESYKRPSHCSD